MSEKDLRLISRLVYKLIFIDENLACTRIGESLALTDKEQDLFKEFLDLGKISADEYCNLIKEGRDLDEMDYRTGSANLVAEYERIKKEYSNFKKKAIIDPDWDCNSYAKYE